MNECLSPVWCAGISGQIRIKRAADPLQFSALQDAALESADMAEALMLELAEDDLRGRVFGTPQADCDCIWYGLVIRRAVWKHGRRTTLPAYADSVEFEYTNT